MTLQNVYAVVMAGGKGERFWPQSRSSHPKQLLRLIGNLTMIEQTVARLSNVIALENCFIVTNREYVLPMRSLLPGLPPENIIGETTGRDTAACVAAAAGIIRARIPQGTDPIMIVTPSDHIVKDDNAFCNVLTDAAAVAKRESQVVTIGVKPGFATTGYGYLHCGETLNFDTPTKFHRGAGFVEKPAMVDARKFLAEGGYLWNSGIFIWTLSVLEEKLAAHAPTLFALYRVIRDAEHKGTLVETMIREYEKLERISIDYALMEKLDQVLIAEATFDWDDVGSWTALRNQIKPDSNNNVVQGLYAGLGVKNCIVIGGNDHLIGAIDVDDLIIVHTDDATLVCNGKSAQRVKNLLQMLGSNPELQKFL